MDVRRAFISVASRALAPRAFAALHPTASPRLCCSPSRTAIGRADLKAGFVLAAGHKEEKRVSEAEKKSPPQKLAPAKVPRGESPLVLTAPLELIADDRFEPAGFPEIGHVTGCKWTAFERPAPPG
ncbi:MAG: hypothetical protein CFK52_00210 [Chloracidobacterium sp. CP2_5A]|nr:MAG: hypothetical protein CFK52_00210 [Chloracidobacterium sp. CP2_5A]